jgi:alkanesulfonate monooxygenase SsuD/methylene tetrahydromethanopterin reductase-like flavin-dependent oxidoreductase (luciferase family)
LSLSISAADATRFRSAVAEAIALRYQSWCSSSTARITLRHAAEYGDGWFGLNISPAEAGSNIKRLEQLLSENGHKRWRCAEITNEKLDA